MRILVVEAEGVIAMGLEAVLMDLGHSTVGPASSNAEAKALLHATPIDCAILDVALVDGGTIAFGRELLERAIPIVFTTGYLAETLQLPADVACVQKPYAAGDIKRCVQDLSDKRAAASHFTR